jgi:GT2 family glycosyltransferase
MNMLSGCDSPARVGVAIVNWNSGKQVLACINSLLSCSSAHAIDIVVVDNASDDGSMDALHDMKGVKKIYAKTNFGFGKGCNLAAKELNNEFILFLNPDAGVYKDTLNQVLNFMDSPAAANVGICGVQLLDENRLVARSCARLPTVSSFLFQALGILKIKQFCFLGSKMDEWDHGSSRAVDQLIGAFFFVRRELFEKLEGFDERFFVYFEEVDFSLRAKRLGWASFYLATAQAFHAGGGTSNQVKAKRLFYSLRSRLLYAFKNFSIIGALGVLFSTLFLEFLSRSFLAMSRLSWMSFKENLIGYSMLFKWLCQRPISKLKT